MRKYSVRYTTYGPPVNKLLLLIHALDRQRRPCPDIVGSPTNILSSTRIAEQLDLLHETRALGDRKFEQEEAEGDSMMSRSRDMDLRGEDPLLDDRLLEPLEDSQTGFSTQIAHPPRPNAIGGTNANDDSLNRDDVPSPGGNLIQPVNVRTREAVINDDDKMKQMLLSLINHGRPAVVPTETSPVYQSHEGRQGGLEAHHINAGPSRSGSKRSPQLSINDQPTSIAKLSRHTSQSEPDNHSLEEDGINFPSNESPSNTVAPVTPERQAKPDIYTSGADWVGELQFDADSAQVMRNQQTLLNMTDSWAKPQPGYKFPDGSVPIEVYKEIAAIVEPTNALDEEPEPMDVEEPVSADANHNDAVASEEDDEDSRVSWSSSPSPEAPNIPSRIRQALPPDSSFESLQNSTPKNTAGAGAHSRGRALEDVPSSPPAEVAYINSDDEMDLEIPRGLGDESPMKSKARGMPLIAAQTSPEVPHSRSLVQVKDTPNAKEKSHGLQPRGSSSSQPNQISSGTSGDLSSASIVFGTYNDPTCLTNNATKPNVSDGTLSTVTQETRAKVPADNDDIMTDEPLYAVRTHVSSMPLQERRAQSPAPQISVEDEHAVELLSSPASARLPPQSNRSPVAQPMSLLDSNNRKSPGVSSTNSRSTLDVEQPVKRKSDLSPSKTNPRPSKRREIKIFPFHSSSQDRMVDYRKEKKASIERLRAERQNTTESHNLSGLQIRGSLGLQEPSANGDPYNSVLEHQPSTSRTPQGAQRRSQTSSTHTISPTPGRLRDGDQVSTQNLKQDSTASIFDTFKQAYPEYQGDITHFVNQCKQMYRHEMDDKMVPKWMWDDFLIRNRTDFKDYALQCMDAGEDPGPYIRYYKDHIQKTIYEKGVLKEVGTLVRALGELGYQPPPPTGPAADRNHERSRHSFLGTASRSPSSLSLTQQRSTRPGSSQGRQPLPDVSPRDRNQVSGGHTNRENLSMQTSINKSTDSSKAKPNPKAAQKTNNSTGSRTSGLNQADEMTGDAFRDFVLGQKKMTAVTGSTKVHAHLKPYEMNRD